MNRNISTPLMNPELREQRREQTITAAMLVVFAVASRMVFNKLHIYNFNAVMAAALFGGAYLTRSKVAMWVPVVTLLITDLVLGFYDWKLMSVVYGSFLLTGLYGRFYSKNATLLRYVLSVLGGSLSFFLLTNFAVWVFGDGSFYPKTLAGLMLSYTEALPFYRNTLLGDLFFTSVLFGGYHLMELSFARRLRPIKN